MSLSQAASDEYQHLWDTMVIRPEWLEQAHRNAEVILGRWSRYQTVGETFRMDPRLVGVIHMMEASFDWRSHLANGDPLTHRTTHVPRGLIAGIDPPYTWEQGAIAALRHEGAAQASFASLPEWLYFLEGYNGWGYRAHGINTPYLWSGSNHYTMGKYASDGHFDANLVSKQIGCAPVLKAIHDIKAEVRAG